MKDKRVPLIELIDVSKDFQVGKKGVEVLNDINLKIYDGEFIVIFGPSGCGKSTLLNTIIGLEPPTKGIVKFRGENIYLLDEDDLARFRRKYIGIVFQQSNWIKSLKVAENVAYPLIIAGGSHKIAYDSAMERLKEFELEQFAKYVPTELSGGEQQRVTICRALISNPDIIVADEPTGNLDKSTGEKVMDTFKDINKASDRTILIVSHNPDYAKYASKIVYMSDGVIEKVVDNKKTREVRK